MRKVGAAIVLGLSLRAAAAVAGDAGTESSHWHFKVLLDGKRVGEHDFALTHKNDEIVIDDVAHFKVTVALIPVCVYDHQNHEEWRNGLHHPLQSAQRQWQERFSCKA